MTNIMYACGKDHGCHLQICQLLSKLVIGQKATQRLCHISSVNVVVVRVVVVRPLYVLCTVRSKASGKCLRLMINLHTDFAERVIQDWIIVA